MEFWGVEVKAGEPIKVEPLPGMVIHLSQACLGEIKSKGNDSALLHVKVGDQKLVLGTLNSDKFPQLAFDLVFEQEFELSHNLKTGSIHFCGYQTSLGEQGEDDFGDFDESDSEEEQDVIPENVVQNGKGGQKGEQAKPAAAVKSASAAKPEPSDKPKAKIAQPTGEDDVDSDEDDDSSDDDDSENDSDEDMIGNDSDDDDDEDDDNSDSDNTDEETPKKPVVGKKRANDSAAKSPVSAKKAKAASPKSDGKKVGGHTATPHPAKKAGKPQATPNTADKSKAQTPKSSGITCKSCSKSFGSDKALESHTKAKHA